MIDKWKEAGERDEARRKVLEAEVDAAIRTARTRGARTDALEAEVATLREQVDALMAVVDIS